MGDGVSIRIERQGRLFKLAVMGLPREGGGKRGKITGFSAASRKRLLDMLARLRFTLESGLAALFVTLTYPAEFPACDQAYAHWRAFEERLRRRFPAGSAVWRRDFQRRGAPHFHVLLFGVPFLAVSEVRAWWSDIIGYTGSAPLQVDVAAVRSWRGVVSYAAKYMARVGGDQLDSITYPHGEEKSIGRTWGVFNGDLLPYDVLDTFDATWGRWFFRVKRAARHVWRGVSGSADHGCTLYRDDPGQWFAYAGAEWAGT